MTSFLSLPYEIRRMIYTHALVIDYIRPYFALQGEKYLCYHSDTMPPGRFWQSMADLPDVDLLQTCRQIHAEASPILYAENQILLPILDLTLRFFKRCLHTPERCSWVKSVGLSLESADMYERQREIVFNRHWKELREVMTSALYPGRYEYKGLQHEFQEWGKGLHLAYKRHLTQVIWPRKVAPVLDLLSLDRLLLYLDCPTCHDGCCVLTNSALSSFTPGFAKGVPKSVEFITYPQASLYETVCKAHKDDDDDDGCDVARANRIIQNLMTRWTEQRQKKSYSLKEGFKTVKRAFWLIEEEEGLEGSW
ncbi:hypothetical protein MMC26_006786 [Xylographa opegraphella]|nr:hypothetical protein [Xylographa opegraphella]